ncbi:unnamed protein product, partial [Amoebophrya sp. A25]|eukprot:GSA25T00023672001.1
MSRRCCPRGEAPPWQRMFLQVVLIAIPAFSRSRRDPRARNPFLELASSEPVRVNSTVSPSVEPQPTPSSDSAYKATADPAPSDKVTDDSASSDATKVDPTSFLDLNK